MYIIVCHFSLLPFSLSSWDWYGPESCEKEDDSICAGLVGFLSSPFCAFCCGTAVDLITFANTEQTLAFVAQVSFHWCDVIIASVIIVH